MISSNTYEEVYQILKKMDKSSVMQIPENILQNIINNRNPNFKTNIKKDDLFNQENISKESLDILCWLTYTYWMDDDEKQEIDKINSEYNDKENKLKYTSDDLFKNTYSNDNSIEIIPEYKDNIFRKIIEKIRKILKL